MRFPVSFLCQLLLAEAAVGAVALLIVELLSRQLISIFEAANESIYIVECKDYNKCIFENEDNFGGTKR